jgi:hypothetical protein
MFVAKLKMAQYLELITPGSGVKIERCHRYSGDESAGFIGSKVVATRDW